MAFLKLIKLSAFPKHHTNLPSKGLHFEGAFSSELLPCSLDLEKHRQHLPRAAKEEKEIKLVLITTQHSLYI
jgi:hypothetical protein